MKKKAKELEFISQIKPDGSGVTKIKKKYLKYVLESSLMKDQYYELHQLSLTHKTFVAINFIAFVVKLKN
jgi:hypothetical protein